MRKKVVAYLFAQRYFDEEGDVARGAKVFETKSCMSCHEQQRAQTGAPDLARVAERYSPITISSSLWRHGPAMLEIMRKRNITWPQFSGREMSDLIAYLNSRLIRSVAQPNN